MSSMFTLCKDQSLQSLSFDGSRLILPSVSVGNVSQLVVDLFINTLQLPRVGHLHHTSILPLVGSSAYSHTTNTLHTAAEVYHSSELKVTIIQMRTPIAKGCGETFCADLLQWIRSSQFSDVVLLTSTHAHERIDSQIQGSSIRYLLSPCPSLSSLHTHFSQDLHWSPLEPRGKNTTTTAENTTGVLKKSELFIPGSGVSKRLYLKCCSEDVPLVVLLTFSSQGDNIPEALQLATVIDSWLNLRDKSLCSEFHVLAAVNKAVMKREHKQMKTKTVYSEMIYSLSPSTNISESFKNFGIRDDSSSVLVVVLCPDKDDPLVESAVDAVEGELVPLDNLISLTDENAVKKVYKLSDEESAISSLENSVVTRIATRDIM